MKYACTLRFKCGSALLSAFEPEQTKHRERSKITITPEKGGVIFDVEAQDAVALRAAINSTIKLLIVWEAIENGIATKRTGKAKKTPRT